MSITEKEITTNSNWFEEYDKPKETTENQLPIFKMDLAPNQLARTETITFLSEGKEMETKFGKTIVFNINHNKEDKVWFIKKTQYNLLNPIAKQKKTTDLNGKVAEVQRVGSGQKDTKWSITFK
jgi:hypothetical protein